MTKTSTNEKAEPKKEEYFFSGGTEYEPISITSTSREEAEREWEKVRKPVAPASTAPQASTGGVDLQAKEGVE